MTLLTFFWCLYCCLWTDSKDCSSASIENFEKVNAGWKDTRTYETWLQEHYFSCFIVDKVTTLMQICRNVTSIWSVWTWCHIASFLWKFIFWCWQIRICTSIFTKSLKSELQKHLLLVSLLLLMLRPLKKYIFKNLRKCIYYLGIYLLKKLTKCWGERLGLSSIVFKKYID